MAENNQQPKVIPGLTTKTQVNSPIETLLEITVPVDYIRPKVDGRIRHMAKTAKLDGFRKGKVPVSHIRAQYGAGIQQEVINDVLGDAVFQAIRDESIRVVGTPKVENVDLNQDRLAFSATVETFPEVDVNPISDSAVERMTAVITDEDVDVMIESLRKQRQSFVEKQGIAEEGNQVTIDFVGKIDGEPFEGGSASDFNLEIGSNSMIPGFEDGVAGMQAGDTKTLDITFPEDYSEASLQGKEAQFDITVKQVSEAKLPDMDDEFFELFGVEEGGLDKLKADVRKNMEREIKNASRMQVKKAVFDALIERNEVDLPSGMLQEEIRRQRQLAAQRLAQQFGQAMQNMNIDENMLPDEMFEDEAKRSATLGVLVSRIIETNDIKVDQDRVTAFIEETAENYEDPQEVIEYYTNDAEQRANVESIVLEDQVVDKLLAEADITDKELGYQELLSNARG